MQYQDKSGMFADFNFKLVVIDGILDQHPSFEASLAEMKKRYVEPYEWYKNDEIIPEMAEFFAELVLTQEDLDRCTHLVFDGGDNIYFLLKPDWDGELDIFDVTSFAGVERLRNLRSVYWTSMCEARLLAPLHERGVEIKDWQFIRYLV